MKKRIFTTILLFNCLISSVHAEGIEEGKYMFYAPALFESNDSEPYGALCEISKEGDRYKAYFLDVFAQGSSICFTMNGDEISFDETQWSYSEYGQTITGKGTVKGKAEAQGSINVTTGTVGYPFVRNRSSQWAIRPATSQEIRLSVEKGLKVVEEYIWATRVQMERTQENVLKSLSIGIGRGFSEKDLPELERMMEFGDLNFTDGKFSFRETFPAEVVPLRLPISTNVFVEDIDLQPLLSTSIIPIQVVALSADVASIHESEMVSVDPLVKDTAPTPQEESGTTHRLLPYLVGALVLVGVSAVFMIGRRRR